MPEDVTQLPRGAVSNDQLAEARRHLDKLQSTFVVGTEWGLFRSHAELEKELRENMCEMTTLLGQTSITGADYAEFECLLLDSWSHFNRAMSDWSAAAVLYRLNAHWGLFHIVLALLSSFLAAYIVLWGLFSIPVASGDLREPVFAGIVGALLKSLYWTQFQNGHGLLRPRFFSYFVASGFVGAILGWAASLLIEVSFRLLDPSDKPIEPDWKLLALIALFAGFRWEWVLSKLEKGVEAISGRFVR